MDDTMKRTETNSLSVALTGSGGAGVMTAGNLLLEAVAKAGYYGLMVRSSGPQIRGGEAAALIRIAARPLDCMADRFDLLVGVDWQNIHRFAEEIPLDGSSLMIGDPDQGNPPEVYVKRGARTALVPFKQLSKAIPGSWPNMVMLGAAAALVGLPAEAVESVVRKYKKAGGDALRASLAAVQAG
jgi:2-oxoglutarate ferredoxin oxidoreductase subunit alpha